MPLFEAYAAPLLAFGKLLLSLALVRGRLGWVSFPFSLVWLSLTFAFGFAFSFAFFLLVVWVTKLLSFALAFALRLLLGYLAKLYPTHCSSLFRFARVCC